MLIIETMYVVGLMRDFTTLKFHDFELPQALCECVDLMAPEFINYLQS
jgi:hypothetical protein